MSNFNTTVSTEQYKTDLAACGDMPQGISGAFGAKLLVINKKVAVHRKHMQHVEAINDAAYAVSIAHRAVEHAQYDVSKEHEGCLHREALEYLDTWVERLQDAEKLLQECRDEASIYGEAAAA